jgi:hypothetical protein
VTHGGFYLQLVHRTQQIFNQVIQMDIGGHPPFPTGSKQRSDIFDNLLFLAVFRVLNFWSHFEALNDIFLGYVAVAKFHHGILSKML